MPGTELKVFHFAQNIIWFKHPLRHSVSARFCDFYLVWTKKNEMKQKMLNEIKTIRKIKKINIKQKEQNRIKWNISCQLVAIVVV